MNALTIGATLGILVLCFQEGWLSGLLDYPGPAALEINTLVFLVAIVFGLSTDYAVLVMARIKEQHDRGATNEDAVATGIGRTGRVITAAALMLSVVFMAFAVSPIFFMKQVAVGQAVGVLIDATIVRALLVPSLMRLFGEWNWWAPAPLKRIQRRYGFQAT
jgi:RND superfamily putative drug exporter